MNADDIAAALDRIADGPTDRAQASDMDDLPVIVRAAVAYRDLLRRIEMGWIEGELRAIVGEAMQAFNGTFSERVEARRVAADRIIALFREGGSA